MERDASLELIALTPKSIDDLLAGDAAMLGDAAARLSESTLKLLQQVAEGYRHLMHTRGPAAPPWTGYLAIDRRTGLPVGTCGFKGPPVNGEVEIAYFTFPAEEGCGRGRQMATQLVAIAARSNAVSSVVAHTLPAENASTAILRRTGFTLNGPVEDPEDGIVWRWSIPLSRLEVEG